MVLKYPYLKIAVIVLMYSIATSSCEKDIFVYVDCNNCFDTEPSAANVTIDVNSHINGLSNLSVYIYEGDKAEGIAIMEYIDASFSSIDLDLAINRTYTFVAIYTIEGKNYRVVASVRPAVKFTESQCDEACYFVYNNKINLRLKYF
jgi:hypothetical protein